MAPIIGIKHLSKVFKNANGDVKALEDINLDIEEGEIFGIIGLSGAGKSTLVRCINYLEIPTEGEIVFQGKPLSTMNEKEIRQVRRSMGMIFQQFNLLAQRNVLDNIRFPLELAGVDKEASIHRAKELLEIVGLSDRAKAYPAQLSGGQKQRVAIARAIATNPKVLLCDEATSALDPNTTKQILDLLKDINKRFGITVIVITHEMKVVESICDTVAIIDQSHIAESGKVSEIFADPKTKIGRQLIVSGATTETKYWTKGGNGKKIRITFGSKTVNDPVLGEMILACGTPINIIFASFKEMNGIDYGQMIVELPEDKEKERVCIDYLDTHNVDYEEVDNNAI